MAHSKKTKGIGSRRWLLYPVYTIIALLVIVTLFGMFLRIGIHYLENHPEYLKSWLEEELSAEVKLTGMNIDSRGKGIHFEVHGLDISEKNSKEKILAAKRAHVEVDWLASSLAFSFITKNIELVSPYVSLTHHLDGSISLGSLRTFKNRGGKRSKFNEWLFNQRRAQMSDLTLKYYSERQKKSWLITKANLKIIPSGLTSRQLELSSQFAADGGGSLKALFKWRGNLAIPTDWNGRGYAKGHGVPLEMFSSFVSNKLLRLDKSLMNVDAHLVWRKGILDQTVGHFGLHETKFTNLKTNTEMTLGDVKGDFFIKGNNKERKGQLVLEFPDFGQHKGFRLETAIWRDDREFIFHLAEFNTKHLAYFLPFINSDKIRERMQDMKIKGKLSDIKVLYHLDNKIEGLRTSFSFKDIAFNRVGKAPGVKTVNGRWKSRGKDANLELDSNRLVLDFGEWFRAPILIGQVKTKAKLKLLEDKQWLISTDKIEAHTDDATAIMSAKIRSIPGVKKRPYVEIKGNFQVSSARRFPKYMPVKIMKPKAIKWFDNAFEQAKVSKGTMYLLGDLNKYPFATHKDGIFKMDMVVDQAKLKFQPKWPHVTDIQGNLTFAQQGMTAVVKKAKMAGAQFRNVNISIDSFKSKTSTLTLKGSHTDSLVKMQNFVRDTPLKKIIHKPLSQLTLSNKATLKLLMKIPLKKGSKEKTIPKIDGQLTFGGNQMQVKAANLKLENVKGVLKFSEKSLSAHKLRATSPQLGGNISTDIKTINSLTAKNGQIKIALSGSAQAEKLKKWVDVLLPTMKGKTKYTADLVFNKTANNHLKISSNLQGMSVFVPDIIDKKKNAKLPTTATVNWNPKTMKVSFKLAGKLKGSMQKSLKRKSAPWHGGLRLGNGKIVQQKSGITISGNPAVINYDKWDAWLGTKLKKSSGKANKAGKALALYLQGTIGQLNFGDMSFHRIKTKAKHVNKKWSVSFSSTKISGNAVIPDNARKAISVALNHYKVDNSKSNTSAKKTAKKSREFIKRPLRLSINKLSLNNKNLGVFKVNFAPYAGGVQINNALIRNRAFTIKANGRWQKHNNKTSIRAKLAANSLGGMMSNFGYTGKIYHGKTKLAANLFWPGTPADFDFAYLNGDAGLNVGSGVFDDIDARSGKVLSLLGLHTINRRLRRNWRDMKGKGLNFDRIVGNFKIKNGITRTKNSRLDASTAMVVFDGNINLARQLFDLRIIVTPRLSNSLPILGAAIGGLPGAAAGAAVALLDKMSKRRIDRMMRSKYSLKGKWDKPIVKKINRGDKKHPAHKVDTLTGLPEING